MTKYVETTAEVRRYVAAQKREGRRVGFVPTMGALHEGHMSLIHRAGRDTDRVIVSIFVNPLQFGPGEDYDQYPRSMDQDLNQCEAAGVHMIFVPSVAEMYPKGFQTFIGQEELPGHLCGRARPGFFRGVMTVVAKLFNIVTPDVAYFGQKDYQQALIIQRMARDLHIDTRVELLPIIREEDGLAMSSRNKYLGPKQRRDAACLYSSLCAAKQRIEAGQSNARESSAEIRKHILSRAKGARIEYISICNPETLAEIKEIRGRVLIALAVGIGKARLIDNILIG